MTAALPSLIFSLALTALVLAAAIFDATRLRIPNQIPLLLIGLFALKAMAGLGTGALMSHLRVFALVLVLGFLAFAAGLFGGGDAKLLAALGLWFGPAATADLVVITGIAGGVLAYLLLLARRFAAPAVALPDGAAASFPSRLMDPKAPVPYALPIAFASLWLTWF
jgi:prepilin peptidase CpaA